MKSELLIQTPGDYHVHVRRGPMMKAVLPYTVRQFGRALLMPNTLPKGIFTAHDVAAYRSEVLSEVDDLAFEPLMSIKLCDDTTPQMVADAYAEGAVAAKIYPRGVTTNSDDGVENVMGLRRVFGAIQELGMLLLLHGEHPQAYYADAETRFLPILRQIHAEFPNLRIVLEHVSTKAAVRNVLSLGPNVAATITIHHMLLTGDDVVKGKMRAHNYCLPIAKRPEDRDAVLAAALSGDPKFFLGTDSAPHPVDRKECAECSGGIFTAPCALEYLATIFEQHGCLDKLENFCSTFGAQHYGLPVCQGKIRLVREEWEIEDQYAGVKSFRHFKTLPWKFAGKIS